MSEFIDSRRFRRSTISKRRVGYLVWGVAAGVLVVPQIFASIDPGRAPIRAFTYTLNAIRRHHAWVGVAGLFMIAVVQSARSGPEFLENIRTPGGRLTSGPKANMKPPEAFADESPPALFVVGVGALALFVELAVFATAQWWGGPTAHDRQFRAGTVLYGLIFLLCFFVPSGVALLLGEDVPFPTLSRTSGDLAAWLAARPSPLAPLAAFFFYHVIFVAPAFLVVEALHG